MSISRDDLEVGRVDLGDVIDEDAGPIGPIHPGEILRDTLDEAGVSAYALAKAIGVPLTRVTAILAGRRAITADTALRLGRYFGTGAEMWLGLQMQHDLEIARQRAAKIEREVKPRAA